jgi:WD40-like Beta Propeller Repeat
MAPFIKLALAAVAATGVAAPAAQADSISYIKDGNVYLTTPDGSRTHQVTTAGGYSYASQADDGRIAALKGSRIELLDRWGTVQADFSPVAPGTAGTITFNGPFDPVISLDGTRIAYGFYVQYTHGNPDCGLPGGCWEGHLYAGTGYSPSSGPAEWSDPRFAPAYGWTDPAWIDDARTLQSGPSSAYLSQTGIDVLGDDEHEAAEWFSDFTSGAENLFDAELNRQGTGLAAVANAAGDSLRVYRVSGTPAKGNPPEGCLSAPSHGSAYESPSWSPDGARLAFSDGTGISVAGIPGLAAGCPDASTIEVKAIAPGGRLPDWGPADLPDPASRPTPSSPGGGGGSPAPATSRGATPTPAPALKVARGKGLSVKVTVSAPGTLSAGAKKDARTIATAAPRKVKAGTVTLMLKRTKAGRHARGRVSVRVRYKAGAAPAREATVTVRLR